MTEPLWRDLTHQQVWDQVHAGPGPYVSDGAAGAWNAAEAALRQIDGDLDAAIAKAAGWTGSAAEAARSGLTPLGGWAVDATVSAGRAATSLTEHQVQVAWVRANLPEPGPAPGIDPPIPLSDAGVDPAVLQQWTVTVGRNIARADQAFHVMDTYATNTALIQQQVPAWSPPPAVTVSVAGMPPPIGQATTRPERAVGTPAARITPAAALPAAAGVSAGAAAMVGGTVLPDPARLPGAGNGIGVLGRVSPAAVSTIPPTAPGAADPLVGGPGAATRDGSTPAVVGAVAGRTLPAVQAPSTRDGSGLLRGLPEGAAPPARGTGGGPDGPAPRAGSGADGSGPGRAATGALRGLPGGSATATGVLRGTPDGSARDGLVSGRSSASAPPFGQGSDGIGDLPRSSLGGGAQGDPGSGAPGTRPGGGLHGGGPADPGSGYLGGRSAEPGGGYLGGRPADPGTGVLGGHPGDPAAPGRGGTPIVDPALRGGGVTDGMPGRSTVGGYPGYLPAAGVGLGNRAETHRRPDYLVHAYAFFADDRRLAGPVITPEAP